MFFFHGTADELLMMKDEVLKHVVMNSFLIVDGK